MLGLHITFTKLEIIHICPIKVFFKYIRTNITNKWLIFGRKQQKILLCVRSNSNCHKTIENQHGLIFRLLLKEIENSVTAWQRDGQVLLAVYSSGKSTQTLMGLDILEYHLDTLSNTKDLPDVLQLWVWEGSLWQRDGHFGYVHSNGHRI